MKRRLILALALSFAFTALATQESLAIVLTFTEIPIPNSKPARLYDVDTNTGVVSIRAELTIQDDYFAMDTRPRVFSQLM